MFSNVLCIHLKRFKNVEDFEILFEDHGLDSFDPEACYNLMLEGYTKVFIDIKTHKILAYCHQEDKKNINVAYEFIDFLRKMDSITPTRYKSELTVDLILDKINKYGINSLTKREQNFLNNNN